MSQPLLLEPITVRCVTGVANDWHLVHLGKFAQGGASMVMVEAAAVTAEGRITHGDIGLWHDGPIAPLRSA